ncbi:MAG: hypothetical protein K8H88_20705, partial [Sandaracinaceae bacterium]|nr:hypothetical protein [Sandaracinaceae bacterium]
MSALTSLLARDGVVSVRTIEQALQQQVIRGGDVETILLEMGAIAENVLAGYQAALHERRGATREQVMGVPPEVIALVPAEVAIERSLVPLALEGRRLVVAVREPLSDEARGQLEFLLGHEVVERIACEPRLMAALAHHYGAPIAPRMARLIGKLLGRDPGVLPEADIEIGRLSGHAIEIPIKRTRPSRRFLLEPAPP